MTDNTFDICIYITQQCTSHTLSGVRVTEYLDNTTLKCEVNGPMLRTVNLDKLCRIVYPV